MIYIYTQQFIQSFKINDSPLTYNEKGENGWLLAPVKANSIITATGNFRLQSYPIRVIEYKLIDTNPHVAFPDWDENKKITINNGNSIPDNGWIVFRVDDSTSMDNTYTGMAYINDIKVYFWTWEQNGDNNTNPIIVPVSKGDVLTYTDASGRMSCTFYPAKAVAQPQCVSYVVETNHGTNDDGSTWWYRLYSDGWCE
jgi:hypothetical protein